MQITVVAVMCHTLGAITAQSVGSLPDLVCREVIIIKDEMPMQSCMLSQAALADWKDRSIYRGDSCWISRIKCVPGDYVPKERVEPSIIRLIAIPDRRQPAHGPGKPTSRRSLTTVQLMSKQAGCPKPWEGRRVSPPPGPRPTRWAWLRRNPT